MIDVTHIPNNSLSSEYFLRVWRGSEGSTGQTLWQQCSVDAVPMVMEHEQYFRLTKLTEFKTQHRLGS